MSYRNIVQKPDGTQVTFNYTKSEGGAKAWNESLAKDYKCEVRLEHVADGPYDNSGKVTHVQTSNGAS